MVFYNSMFASFEGSLADFNQIMESNLMKAFLGGSYDLSRPEGWLSAELLPLLGPLIFIVFAVSFASSELAGEEEKGTLNLLLSHPISRTSVFLDKSCALALATLSLGIVFWLTFTITISIVNMGIPFLSVAEVTFSLILLGFLFGALALALGGSTGKRSVVIGVTSAFAIASYLLNSMSEIIPSLEGYRVLSVFYHYGGGTILLSGIKLKSVGILLGIGVLLLFVGLYAFQHRDIGT
jgi:ABC-2 type transport system permease protein